MEYRHLGSSGFRIPVLGLGGNIFGRQRETSHFTNQSETAQIVFRALDLGANFIDTSDSYTGGDSESFLGQILAGQRHKFIIASKVGWEPNHKIAAGYQMGPNEAGLSRGHIMDGIDGTLRRLGTDYVDLYYAHKPDPHTPWEETLRAFDDLVQIGKVRYVACSNFAGWQIAAMSEISAHRGYTPLMASQSLYNLFDRQIEREVLPACRRYKLSLLPYSPLAQGVLTGKYRADEPAPRGTRGFGNTSPRFRAYMTPSRLQAIASLDMWSQDHGYRVGDLALAWLLAQPGVTSVINAVTNVTQLESNIRATGWTLSKSQLQEVADTIDVLADH